MGRDSSYRTVALLDRYCGPLPIHVEQTRRRARLQADVRLGVAARGLHRLLRIAVRASSRERREPWAVADQRDRAPVGERIAAYLELEVLGTGRVPDQLPRLRLVSMEHVESMLDGLGSRRDGTRP